MSSLSERQTDRALRASLVGATAYAAFCAFAGAIGLVGGGAGLGNEAGVRLLFASPAFAAAMLTLLVGVPMSTTAALTLRCDSRATPVGIGGGLLLVSWIVVQPFVIGQFHWLQPVFGALGVAVCVLAYRLHRHRARHSAPGSTGLAVPA
ncbi:hypothetical protein [Nocardia xishanensis]|uniref:hypothetical protein n=1 Tax=Nocardia xishanensis TaxID=238964 RepID=UPI00082BF3AE|nr:hypothetical protein [Nocardia xishanensis]